MIVSRSFITYLTDQLDTSNWANPFSFFGGRHVYLLPGALSFDFAMTLTFALEVKLRVFFIGIGFSLISSKVQGGFWSKLQRQVAHDQIIVDL